MEDKNESYLSYYIFVLISGIIGFVALVAITKLCISFASSQNGMISFNENGVLPFIVALVGLILFIIIAVVFRKFLKKLLLSEVFLYLYMGVLTTAINIIAFQKLLQVFVTDNTAEGLGWKFAELVAFVIAVIFAYITNKIFVFKSMSFAPKVLFKEIGEFFGARIITELINFIMMYLLIDKLQQSEIFTKILASIIVIVLNYIFSKLIIFKKETNEKK